MMTELTYSKCDCCGTMYETSELFFTKSFSKEFDGLACKFCRPDILGYVQFKDLTELDHQTLLNELRRVQDDESLDMDHVENAIEDSDLVLFQDYKEFFYWKHEDCSKDYLIFCLLEGGNNLGEYVELEHGRIAFFY